LQQREERIHVAGRWALSFKRTLLKSGILKISARYNKYMLVAVERVVFLDCS
jgi:hypothetical protein